MLHATTMTLAGIVACQIGVAIYLPAAQSFLGTRPLSGGELAVLATFPFIVWGVDEAYRAIRRRRATRRQPA